MQNILHNNLVAVRQSKCQQGAICIDTELGIAKGYTQAKRFHSHKPSDKVIAEITEKQTITNHESQRVLHRFPSGVFKFLGVDYVG